MNLTDLSQWLAIALLFCGLAALAYCLFEDRIR